MSAETRAMFSCATYFATNFTTLVEKPWLARVTTDVVVNTSDQIPSRSTPIVRIKKRYRTKSAAALPTTWPIVVTAFRRICSFFIFREKEGSKR